VSPERLANCDFVRRIFTNSNSNNKIGLLVVDEAHCISVWGYAFRPDYQRLIDVVRSLPVSLRVLGTTATATERIVKDVRRHLGDDVVVQRGSLLRETLHLQNISMPDQSSRLAWLAENIPQLPRSGIIYVLRKLDAEQVTDWLRHKRIDARAYYAGVVPSGDLADETPYINDAEGYREYLENLLTQDRIKVLVATIALGMGFDKPDLGFVIHFQVSFRLWRSNLDAAASDRLIIYTVSIDLTQSVFNLS
jgi:ATP-dependent DNA helicase RecQ